MTARVRHRAAAIAFVGSLLAHLVANGVAVLFNVPVIIGAGRILATVVAIGSALVLFLDSSVWAIARNTIAQAIRVKVAFVIMAVYLILVVCIPFIVKGDGTLRGQLHVVIAYSLIVAGLLLGILTLTVSTTTLWTELRDKQIFLLEAKPVCRWQVLLGKLLGILLMNAALLTFMGVVTWASVTYLVAKAQSAAASISADDTPLRERAERRLRDAKEQVLAARRTLLPDPPPATDLHDFVGRNLPMREQRLQRSDRMPPAAMTAPDEATRRQIIRREAIRQLAEEFRNLVNAVPPLYGRRWRFTGLRIPRSHSLNLTVRFKFLSSDRKSEEEHVRWEFGVLNRTKAYVQARPFRPDEVHELQVHADTVDQDGVFEVRFYNIEPRRPTLIFSEADSIQVLIPVGGFAGNLTRGLAVIFIEVLLIAVLGLFCSTFLGFPVSPIVALSVLLLTFLVSSLKVEFEKGFTFDQNQQSTTARLAERATRAVTTVLDAILPPFQKYSPSALVSSGEEVPLAMLLDATWRIALLYGGVLMLLGALIFQRREIALATP